MVNLFALWSKKNTASSGNLFLGIVEIIKLHGLNRKNQRKLSIVVQEMLFLFFIKFKIAIFKERCIEGWNDECMYYLRYAIISYIGIVIYWNKISIT